MIYLIGSRATAVWHDWKVPEHADWDVVCSPLMAGGLLGKPVDPNAFSWRLEENIELHNENFFCNKEVEKYDSRKVVSVAGTCISAIVCNSRGLAAIKRAHLFRYFNFAKHIMQYQLLDRDFDESDLDFIRRRTLATKEAFGDPVGSKDVSNADFFTDGVSRDFDHENLHSIVAQGTPAYVKLKRDQSKAAYDFDLWEATSHDGKIQAIREECYVIALERWLIPYRLRGDEYPYRLAFDKALEKACTTLDDGPFREYAIDHWQEIRQFDSSIFNRFFESQLWKSHND